MASGGTPNITIEPLGDQHSRAAFSCGDNVIDRWCKKTAPAEHAKYKSRSFVATRTGENNVIGIYSLSMRSLSASTLHNSGYSKEVPALYFAALGVCTADMNQGIGSALMVDAFKRALRVADKAKFYEDRQFARIKPGKLDMYVLMQTLRDGFTP